MEFKDEAALAHEVKNPLSLIKMNVDYIKSCLNQQFEDNFKIIEREIHKINNIVTNLTIKNEPVYIKNMLDDIIREYDISLQHKKIIFSVSADENVYVMGNFNKLNILFFNLFKNSVEAIDGVGEISARVTSDNDIVIVEIIDTGRGINPEVLKKIGQPYITDKEGGSGLGLAICSSIVKEHNGSIAFKNMEKGCKVSVFLSQRYI